ncbi:unnamed protein product [Adineta ricciae]|uniref:Uncharacterized protein n=1 Tax=Adineta ricciae TaxID=249248 RepID=A0A815VPN4_ADIRI|nr:unnamed protein product [Adineta ricciae]CAF1554326.1 unnamed protein product [Adineta ricciae]
MEASNYLRNNNGIQVEFSLSVSSHSGQNQLCNCLSNNNICRSQAKPCFNYLTSDNISFCAADIQCSILWNHVVIPVHQTIQYVLLIHVTH